MILVFLTNKLVVEAQNQRERRMLPSLKRFLDETDIAQFLSDYEDGENREFEIVGKRGGE